MITSLPAAERSSYSGTVNAGAAPRNTLATVDDSTEAIITIEMVRVGAASPDAGRSTVSTAKKQPAMAALKPAGEVGVGVGGQSGLEA